MRAASYTKQFRKDLKRVKRRGKNPGKLKNVLSKLIDEPLDERDHALVGNYQDGVNVILNQTGCSFISWRTMR